MDYESIIKPPISKILKSGLVRLQTGENVGEHITTEKEELIIVIKGIASITESGKKSKVNSGKTHYIPPEKKHDVKNEENEVLEYYYVVGLLKNQ